MTGIEQVYDLFGGEFETHFHTKNHGHNDQHQPLASAVFPVKKVWNKISCQIME